MNNQAHGLYLLQDGTHADPADVSEQGGVLRHKNGLSVALYADGRPQTVGEDAIRNKNVDAAKIGDEAEPDPQRDSANRPAPVVREPVRPLETRDLKAEDAKRSSVAQAAPR